MKLNPCGKYHHVPGISKELQLKEHLEMKDLLLIGAHLDWSDYFYSTCILSISILLFQIDRNSSFIHHSERNEYFSLNDEHSYIDHDHWQAVKKSEVPERQYFGEFMISFVLPVFILIILIILLSFLLCFHHDAM